MESLVGFLAMLLWQEMTKISRKWGKEVSWVQEKVGNHTQPLFRLAVQSVLHPTPSATRGNYRCQGAERAHTKSITRLSSCWGTRLLQRTWMTAPHSGRQTRKSRWGKCENKIHWLSYALDTTNVDILICFLTIYSSVNRLKYPGLPLSFVYLSSRYKR